VKATSLRLSSHVSISWDNGNAFVGQERSGFLKVVIAGGGSGGVVGLVEVAVSAIIMIQGQVVQSPIKLTHARIN